MWALALKNISVEYLEKIQKVLDHIQNVQRNCYKLGLLLIKNGDTEMGRNLICNGQIHDNSKFKGIEFEHLFFGSSILPEAIKHHQGTNQHHPEYWGSIYKMPDVYLAEMACDLAARSAEFGSDVRQWVEQTATKKYSFAMHDEVGRKITLFLNLLLDTPFKK